MMQAVSQILEQLQGLIQQLTTMISQMGGGASSGAGGDSGASGASGGSSSDMSGMMGGAGMMGAADADKH